VLLEPLPYGDPQDLIAVWGRFDPESGFDFPQFPLSIPEYVDYRAQSRTLEDVAAYRRGRLTVTETGQEPERVAVGVVTANLFPLLRVAPVLGRTFTHEETLPNAAQVVVLHHGYWLRRFGGDPDVVGKSVVSQSAVTSRTRNHGPGGARQTASSHRLGLPRLAAACPCGDCRASYRDRQNVKG
jgi:hypothetical protein